MASYKPTDPLVFAPARGLDRGDVDLPHRHHGFHGPLRGSSIRVGHGFEQHTRRDLPGEAPAILAPAAGALLAAVADDRVPVPIGLGLASGCDLKRERLVVLEIRPAVEPEAGDSITVNSTINTSPFFPDGKSPGARCTAPTDESGKVLA